MVMINYHENGLIACMRNALLNVFVNGLHLKHATRVTATNINIVSSALLTIIDLFDVSIYDDYRNPFMTQIVLCSLNRKVHFFKDYYIFENNEYKWKLQKNYEKAITVNLIELINTTRSS